MNFEVTVRYQGSSITYSATAFDDSAYWMKLRSFAHDLQLPKLIFLSFSEHQWQSSCQDRALLKQLIHVLEQKTAMLSL